MDKKLVLLDIDGTLVEPGTYTPPPSALRAVRAARRNGHKVALCSGRNRAMLAPLLAYGFDAAVSSAGGHIECGGAVLFDCCITPQQAQALRSAMDAAGLYYFLEGPERTFESHGFSEFLRHCAVRGSNSELARWARHAQDEPPVPTVDSYDGSPLYKAVFVSRSAAALRAPAAALDADFECCVMGQDQFGTVNGEFISRAFNKGTAVQVLAAHFGIPMQNTIAIGDSMNDAAMLRAAGVGVCMGNGSAEAQALADEVCPPLAEDGVLRTFARHGLL